MSKYTHFILDVECAYDKCPHCGSDEGMMQINYQHYAEYYSWDGVPKDVGEFQHDRSNIIRCASCENPIPMTSPEIDRRISEILNVQERTENDRI